MPTNNESPELAAAVSEIQHLMTEVSAAEAQIADCQKQLSSEEGMLKSILTTAETPTNKEYLEAGKRACNAGIKASLLSITAYQNDINAYKTEISAIYKRNPEARMNN